MADGLAGIGDYWKKAKSVFSSPVPPEELEAKAKNVSQYVKAEEPKKPVPAGLSTIDVVNKPGVPTKRDRLIKPLEK